VHVNGDLGTQADVSIVARQISAQGREYSSPLYDVRIASHPPAS